MLKMCLIEIWQDGFMRIQSPCDPTALQSEGRGAF